MGSCRLSKPEFVLRNRKCVYLGVWREEIWVCPHSGRCCLPCLTEKLRTGQGAVVKVAAKCPCNKEVALWVLPTQGNCHAKLVGMLPSAFGFPSYDDFIHSSSQAPLLGARAVIPHVVSETLHCQGWHLHRDYPDTRRLGQNTVRMMQFFPGEV